ncbi:MAG: SAM-dependent methyltransferase [Myxococcota bacterium]
MQATESTLRRSAHLSVFAHMGDVYLYHDLYGYILKMSPDILDFLDQFAEPAEVAAVCQRYQDAFEGQPPQQFIDIFDQFACLVAPDDDEITGILYMVPVQSKWNVWRRISGGDQGNGGGGIEFFTAWGEREPARLALTPEETALWNAFDGERRLGEMTKDFDRDLILGLAPRLTHHRVQALKLSSFPLSTYKNRRDMRPPYLTSTMPYAPYVSGQEAGDQGGDAGQPVPAPGDRISTVAYYREQVADAEAQFDHRETTLSHLLRVPHPTLAQRTYGQALADAIAERQLVPASGPVKILEIGAGLGYVARDIHSRLIERGLEVSYDIVELSPALAAVQRTRLGELGITVREGDVLDSDLGTGYHFILANEMLGDLPAVRLTRQQIGADATPDERAAALEALGETGTLITEMGLELNDAPPEFYLTTGAIELVRRLWSALAPGGACVLTEFGELSSYPRLSTQLDHPELSIHFGHLQRAARTIGFTSEFEYIIDLLDWDRTLRGMATTRSYYRALGLMLGEADVKLDKIGYTEDMFNAALAGKVDRDDIGELHFDRIEDRLMGLVPHEFKALILRRPSQ